MKKIILIISSILIVTACSSEPTKPPKLSMEKCREFQKEFSKDLPLGNRQTYLYSSVCNEGPIIQYFYNSNSSAPDVDDLKKIIINRTCDSSRILLERIEGMIFTYFDEKSGKKLIEVNITIDDCT